MVNETEVRPAGGAREGNRFAFLVPLVHPGGRKVRDYSVVERALRETLRSYTAQDHPDVVVIVICHRVPAWAGEVRERVRFIRIDEHPRFAANVNDVEIDKGMKYVLGAIQALAVEGAAYVMPVDGDDFLRTDLARHVLARDLGPHDGFIVRQGYNALVQVAKDRLRILQVFRVQDFDRTCGTCRIFSRAALTRAVGKLDPGLLARSDGLVPEGDGQVIVPDPALLDHLWQVTQPVTTDPWGTIRLLGRHLRQGGAFDFVPLTEPLAAKACGHGNHDGPSSGEVRWSGVRGVADGPEFLRRFGIAEGAIELAPGGTGLWARGTAIGAFNRLRKRLNLDFSYEKQHALELRPGK